MILSIANSIDQAFSGFDYAILKFFHELYLSCGSFLTPFMKFVSFFGNGGIIPIALCLILLWKKKTRHYAFMGLISLLIGFIITNLIVKNLIMRERPYSDVNSDYYQWWISVGSTIETDYSFPSGHATASMALVFSWVLFGNKKKFFLFLLIPLLMGFSRLYLMVHYPSDVIAGFLSGMIGGTISFILYKRVFIKTKWFNKFLCL